MQHTHHSHFSSHILQIHTIHQSINHQSSIINSPPHSIFPHPHSSLLNSTLTLHLSRLLSLKSNHNHSLTLLIPHSLSLSLSLSRLSPQKHASPLLANLSLTLTHITLTSPPHITLCSSSPSPPSWPFLSTLSLSFNTSLFSSTPLHPTHYSHTPSQPFAPLTHSLTSPRPCLVPSHLVRDHAISPRLSSLSSNQALTSHPLTLTLQHNTSSLASLSVSNSPPPPPHLLSPSSSSSWPHSPCQSRPPLLPQTSPLSSLLRPPLSLHSVRPSRRQSPPTHRTPHLTNKPPQLTLPSTPHQHANLDCFVPSACTPSSSSAVVLVVMLYCQHTRPPGPCHTR
jgi:hypothetical protein